MTIPQALESALQHFQSGRLAEAEAIYREILAANPNVPDALHMLGLLALRAGRAEAAEPLMRGAIKLAPNVAEYRNNLGLVLMERGKADEAIESYRAAIAVKQQFPPAHNNLGFALKRAGQLEAAVKCFQAALALAPDYSDAINNLATILLETGHVGQSIECFRRAIAVSPKNVRAHYNLGNALKHDGRAQESIACFREALALAPNLADAHNNLGDALFEVGRIQEAVDSFRRAFEIAPGSPASAMPYHNYLYCLHYHPDYDTRAICAELARWNALYAVPLAGSLQPHLKDRNPNRKIRIGYVSPNFSEHVVGWNLLPLLSYHDHENFEIFCYSSVPRPDAMTDKLKARADVWRDLQNAPDDDVAKIIREDKIDILVDLSLHSAQNRLLLFARKPAPVQLTYLGYCGSTGLQTIDYRFSDPFLDPPELDQPYSEKTIRLPKTYWCYQPGGKTPEVIPPPVLSGGQVTFGCLNNFAKVSDAALQLWSKILAALPGSKLILHAPAGDCRNRVAKFIQPEQIEFVARLGFDEYIRAYQRIDIALDPFPYGGGITTCDALWMGVPVVTLEGKTAVGRGAKSILCNLGLKELVAQTDAEYEEIALRLAKDIHSLSNLREGLRARMISSPLMDAAGFAKDVENAYRQMWREWIAQARP